MTGSTCSPIFSAKYNNPDGHEETGRITLMYTENKTHRIWRNIIPSNNYAAFNEELEATWEARQRKTIKI
jgi:hypothetical protein